MKFRPLQAERLTIRPMRPDDLEPFMARRNQPEGAEFQSWEIPFPRERAEQLIADITAMDGPRDNEWFMAAIEDQATGDVVGDLALHMTWGMRTAEVGYTLAADHWGNGYATEAVERILPYLFNDIGVSRITGMLHPDNIPSAMVLERNGFLFEGRTKLSYWVGDKNTDDLIYGLTRDDWDTWRNRPRHRPTKVTLHAVDQANEAAVFKLKTHKTQEAFVAPMKWSYADALFPEIYNGAPMVPWLRAVHADGELTAFVMVATTTEQHPEPYLWRLLVDRLHQRRGIGGMILDQVVEELKGMGDSTLMTSWVPGRGTPEPFYLAYGFEPTGEVEDGEIVARYRFS